MAQNSQRNLMMAMYRRWVYMTLAIVFSAVLIHRPVFNFQDDKGILYVRSFSMDQSKFVVMQTELDSGLTHVWTTMSVKGLYWCCKAMLWGGILCFLCFFSNRWRIIIATITAVIAGGYYVLLIYYSMKISDVHYATFYPNLSSLLPALVCQMMIMVRQNVIRTSIERADMELEK